MAGQAFVLSGAARADTVTIAPGQEITLSADVVLTGAETFTAGAANQARCKIHGAGRMIRSDPGWTGTLRIEDCDVDGLGLAGVPECNLQMGTCTQFSGKAIDLRGGQAISFAGTNFSTSGQIALALGPDTAVNFRGNYIAADSVVTIVDDSLDSSQDAFYVEGQSTGTKVFQGNLIEKSRIHFNVSGQWLIGGDVPADGNVLVGFRTGMFIDRCDAMIIRGNYSHTKRASDSWNQVKNLAISGSSNITVQHNVFWGENWLVEFNGSGELAYNLLLDAVERGWVLSRDTGGPKIHHNVLVATRDNRYSPTAAFTIEHDQNAAGPPDIEIFNNTFDAAGKCTHAFEGDVVLHGSVVASLRSNAFVGLRVAPPFASFVHGDETTVANPLPPGFGYVDYNLYYNPDSSARVIYSRGVAGKTVRMDAGFARNDVMAGGPVDQQIDPRFAGMPPRTFPFNEADIVGRGTTVCQVLAYYRQVYAPGAGSPLVGAGDPADQAGNTVGAIGAGEPNDRFGRFCDPADVGQPNMAAEVFTCPEVSPAGTGGTGGSVTPGPHGFVCVCDVAPNATPTAGLLVLAAAAAAVLALRPRRRPRR